MDHLNICNIHEINETDDGQLYLVMAHYEGETLKERIAKGPLALDDAVDIATQVGQQAGIVHQHEAITTTSGCYSIRSTTAAMASSFYTNPLGGLADMAITNEGNANRDWNPVYTGISILPAGSGPLYTNTPLRTPDFFIARCSAPS